jgi:3'-5' exoribonuclease
MLHYLDDLDSKMESMRAQFEREANNDDAWTGYNPSLARPLLNTTKFLAKKEEPSKQEEKPPEPAAEQAEEQKAVVAGAVKTVQ